MLINRYRQEKALTSDKVVAMKEALHKSFSAISSSSLTTIVGLFSSFIYELYNRKRFRFSFS